MSRQNSPIEFTAFSKGLVTDSSQLNSLPDSASAMTNMRLLRDGTVRRRVGLKRLDYTPYLSQLMVSDSFEGVYSWKGAGEDGLTNLIVVKYINAGSAYLTFYKVNSAGSIDQIPVSDSSTGPLSAAFIDSGVGAFDVASYGNRLAYSADKDNLISILKFSGSRVYISSEAPLKVRDFWGVEDNDIITGLDLTTGEGLSYRPSVYSTLEYTGNHLYNLRNQGWNRAYLLAGTELFRDPLFFGGTIYNIGVSDFHGASNADVLSDFVYPDTASTTGSKTADRFHSSDYRLTSPTNFRAPMGSVIIDLYSRGSSRTNYLDSWGDGLGISGTPAPVNTLYTDSSVGGCTALSSGFGRLWFSGFKVSQIFGEGNTTPRLQQFVAFSQLALNDNAVTQCYQEADPTDKDSPDIVATDGGLIELSDSLNINKLLLFKSSMLVFASNGVWAISGEDNGYFSALSYKVTKVSEYGCLGPNSVVQVDNSVMYLSEDGVVSLDYDQFGAISSNIITENVISNLYSDFGTVSLSEAGASYNKSSGEVSWVIPTQDGSTALILNTNLGAFYTYNYPDVIDVLTQIALPSGQSIQIEDNVVVGVDQVVVNGDQVILERLESSQASNSRLYLISQDGRLGFASDNPESFYDWENFTAIDSWDAVDPVDSEGYILTSALVAGDTQRSKQVPYLTMMFEKTEDGFYDAGDGDYLPTNESSCKVQAQWEWTNSVKSGRWGREFQAYRHKRFYIPDDLSDGYDDGHSVVTSKNKLRGKGRAISLLMKTEAGKDCHILGWSMLLGITGNV